jgi:phosphate transport system protein
MMTMRKEFHDRLDQLAGQIRDMVALVERAMRDATTGLLTSDPALATSVIQGHGDVCVRQAAADEFALSLLAREQPVAGDLRRIVACLRMTIDLRRMGKLAVHIAEITRDRNPATEVPAPLWRIVRGMGDRALALVAEAARAVSTGDGAMVGALEHDDDLVDWLQQDLYRGLLAKTAELDADVAVELALLGHYYERYADHAVALGRGVAFLSGRDRLDQTVRTVP